MKKVLLLLSSCFFTFLLSANVFAYQAYPNLLVNDTSSLSLLIWENIIETDIDGNERLFQADDEFDLDNFTYDFVGILKVDAFNTLGGGTIAQDPENEFTGVFKYSLTSIDDNPDTPTDPNDKLLTFGLDTDDYIRLYADDITDNTTNNFDARVAFNEFDLNAMATATGAGDGDLWMALEGSDGGSFVENTGVLTAPGTPQAKILNYQWFDPTFLAAGVPELVPQLWPAYAGKDGDLGDNLSEVYTEAEINPTTGGTFPSWTFIGDDPALMNAVPEPTTMLLLGVGLLGCAGVARRKQD